MKSGPGQGGAVSIYFLVTSAAFFGLLVMATDVGRLYLIQGELQAAADSAALAAATQLTGTVEASRRAGDKVTAAFDATTGRDNRYDLRINSIGAPGASGLGASIQTDFFATLNDAQANQNGGQSGGIEWSSGNYPKYARVLITAQAPVMFLPLLKRDSGSPPTVAAAAVAGISSPICSACAIDGLAVVDQSAGTDPLHFGFLPGAFYTLYLSPAQQTPNRPVTLPPPAAPYVILNHVPSGPQSRSLDGSLFALAAGGISSSPGLTPPGSVTIGAAEIAYPDLQGNTSPGTSVGQDILCGLNTRFGVDPAQNLCGTLAGGEFQALALQFSSDSDPGGGAYAAGTGLQDYAGEYDGNSRRILTMAVVDASDSLNVLNFRQFLVEMSPGVTQGLNPALATGAFRAQYLGAPVPLRCGKVGGCTDIALGVGRTVLH